MAEDTYPREDGDRICHQLRTTNWLSGTMVSVLRQFFGFDERISMEKGRLLWTPDAQESQVQIDVVDNLVYKEGVKYPKILVDVDTQEFPHDALQDLMGYRPDGTIDYVNRDQSLFGIECWGFTRLEAAAMGDEVRYFIQAYRHVIAKKYNFDKLRVKTMMKPVKYPKYAEYWICRVLVQFELQETWSVTQEALEATSFHLALNVNKD